MLLDTRYALAWLAAVGAAGGVFFTAWNYWNNSHWQHRADGNGGHVTIDFGGQYLMGRMLREGMGAHLYHRNYQRTLLLRLYPRDDEDATQEVSDVERMMGWMMGDDDPKVADAIGSFLLPLGCGSPVGGAEAWPP